MMTLEEKSIPFPGSARVIFEKKRMKIFLPGQGNLLQF
jgi:hypothetical protein